MFFEDGGETKTDIPKEILHYFTDYCPYCEKTVEKDSLCEKNGRPDGNIEKLWKKERILRIAEGRITQ